MKRRDFLRSTGTGVSAALIGSLWPIAGYSQARDRYQRTLIMVELKGANDGLNTVIPFATPAYYTLRPRIALKRDEVLQLDERTGLHPSLLPLLPQWQSGHLAIVQGLGYAQPNLSHFRSIEIWHTASRSDETLQDGWLTRQFAQSAVPRSFAADGVIVGTNDLGPFSGSGTRAIVLANTEQFLRQARFAQSGVGGGNRALAHVLKTEADIVHAAVGMSGNHEFRTEFPTHAFGQSVRTAAQVLAGKAPVAVLRLSHNGYDTHQNQPGTHASLLRQLGEGLAALKGALIELNRWDQTLIMTYAEFGRRAAENGSTGTDHGTANAHFAMGGQVQGGLYGQAPQLDRLDNGNLPYAVDFRSYYATAIERWWRMPSSVALGGSFQALDFLRA